MVITSMWPTPSIAWFLTISSTKATLKIQNVLELLELAKIEGEY